MSFLNGIIADLRDRRLWPVALVLVAGLIAVPVLLSKSAHTTASPTLSARLPSTPRLPVSVTVDNTPGHSHLSGSGRDPFTQQKLPVAKATTGTSVAGATVGSSIPAGASAALSSIASSGGAAAPSSGGSSSTSSIAPVTGASHPSSTPSKPASPPAPTGLSPDQAYRVGIALTDSSGGLDRIDPLKRLSILPNQGQPLLVELGVLQGGKRVLFAVQPGTAVSGPGECTPGPIDCEVLSLGKNQVEDVGVQGSSGVTDVAQFAVTDIGIDTYPSAAAAHKARAAASAAGRSLLDSSALPALSLFQYQPSIGAVVDLRNLTVGGS
jgi:hypothetical protein